MGKKSRLGEKLLIYGAVGLGAYVLWTVLGGASGIGGRIGGGIKAFGDNIIGGVSGIGKGIGDELTNTSAEQISKTLDLGGVAKNIPNPTTQTFSSPRDNQITKELLGVASLIKDSGYKGITVDVTGRSLNYNFDIGRGVQSLAFAFDDDGYLRTGTTGLNPNTIKAQQALSKKYGIATFDVKGNVSTLGGFASGR